MCMLFATSVAVAQNNDTDEPKSEISVGYGLPLNSSNMCEFLASTWTGSLSNRKLDKDRYIGPLTLEYHYHVTPLIGVGVIGVYSNYKGVYTYGEDPQNINNTYFTVMPSVKFNWLRRDNWGLYSKIALGYTYSKFKEDIEGKNTQKEESANSMNFQVSAIGVEVGSRSVRAFAEFGFGEQGIGLAGVRFRF